MKRRTLDFGRRGPSGDSPPRGPRPRRGRPIHLRLALLVGCLLLVLIAMQKAGDPENWKWMGFDRAEPPRPTDTSAERDVPWPAAEAVPDESRPLAERLPDLDPQLAELVRDFWSQALRRLSHPQRAALLAALFPDPRESDPMRDLPERRAAVLQGLDRAAAEYSVKLLDDPSSEWGEDSQRRQTWYELLFQFQQQWSAETRPALAAALEGGALTAVEIEPLQTAVDQATQSLVVDRTAIPRADDVPFWNRLVQRTRGPEADTATPQPASALQLLQQPDVYRGRWVSITGTLRAARAIDSAQSATGVDRYVEYWLQPDDGSRMPVCVFCTEVSGELPEIGPTLTPLHRRARFTGLYYKVRSYLTAAKQIQFCPTLLAASASIEAEPVSAAPRLPSGPLLVAIVAAVALLAAAVAWWVFASSSRRAVRREEPHAWSEFLPPAEPPPPGEPPSTTTDPGRGRS